MEYLFTYGTLRPSLYHIKARAFGLEKVGDATLTEKFTLRNLGRFPALVPAEEEHTIDGELVRIENLSKADRYEGYVPGGSGLYDRKEVIVNVLQGNDQYSIQAWVYFMKESDAPVISSGDWACR